MWEIVEEFVCVVLDGLVIVVIVIEVCEKDVEFGVAVTELEIVGLEIGGLDSGRSPSSRASPGCQMWRPPRVP